MAEVARQSVIADSNAAIMSESPMGILLGVVGDMVKVMNFKVIYTNS